MLIKAEFVKTLDLEALQKVYEEYVDAQNGLIDSLVMALAPHGDDGKRTDR